MNDFRCSLPSISELLGFVDADSPTTDATPTSFKGPSQSGGTDLAILSDDREASLTNILAFLACSPGRSRRASGRLSSRLGSRHSAAFQHRGGLPPTPPNNAYDSHNSTTSQTRGQSLLYSSCFNRFYKTTQIVEPDALVQLLRPHRAPRLSILRLPQGFDSSPAVPHQALAIESSCAMHCTMLSQAQRLPDHNAQ